jgi:molecular chaperone Hsp33
MDELKLALSEDGLVRVRAALTTDLVKEAIRRHKTAKLGTVALGRALTVAALYPLEEGKVESVSLQYTGHGPLRTVYAEARMSGALRGYVGDPAAVPPGELNFGHQGAGLGLLPGEALHVVRLDGRGNHSVSQVVLKNGEIDEDAEAFFVQSEQVITRIRAEVLLGDDGEVQRAWGVLAQHLPGAPDDALADFSHPAINDAVDLDQLITGALGGGPFKTLSTLKLSFSCPCSRERVESSFLLMSPEELEDMIKEDKGAHVTCRFCETEYNLSEDELRTIIRQREMLMSGKSLGEA